MSEEARNVENIAKTTTENEHDGKAEHVSVKAEVDNNSPIEGMSLDKNIHVGIFRQVLCFRPLEKRVKRKELLAAIMTDQSLAAWR